MPLSDLPTLADLQRTVRVTQKSAMQTRLDRATALQAASEANWREVCAQVNQRDGFCCRCCGRRTNPRGLTLLERGHHHHIVYRSALGEDSTANICLICAECHDEEHVKRTLSIEGNADVALTFSRKDPAGQWYVSRQESSPGVTEKD